MAGSERTDLGLWISDLHASWLIEKKVRMRPSAFSVNTSDLFTLLCRMWEPARKSSELCEESYGRTRHEAFQ